MAKTSKGDDDDNKPAPKCQFWQDSKNFKFLIKLFKAGKIKAKDQPASIPFKYPDAFAKYTPTQFCSQF
jgi:hypothetical protein